MKFEIKNRWTGEVQYTCELSAEVAGKSYGIQLGFAVKQAIAAGADLRAANLRAANLSDANLSAANLSAANLSDANLRDANLSDANLSAANLRDANLSDANLSAANLRDANLSDANLRAANLSAANLSDANLMPIRDDVWAVLAAAPGEARAVQAALVAGKVDGSVYEGECACLVGTLANARGVSYSAIEGLRPASWRPAERFFMGIREGDTPENSQACKLAHEWVSDFVTRMEAAFAPKVAA
jgi:hypothetical protein